MTNRDALIMIDQEARQNRFDVLQDDGSFKFRIPSAQITELAKLGFIKQKFTVAYRITTVKLTRAGRAAIAPRPTKGVDVSAQAKRDIMARRLADD